MKISRAVSFLFGAALLVSAGAFAGETNKGKLELSDKIDVEGKSLDRGSYTVEWDGSGPTVQVKLLQGKQTVATFPAHLTEQASANPKGAYSTSAEPNGSISLTAIYPEGKRIALQLEHNQASK
jgi:hypothetical protein